MLKRQRTVALGGVVGGATCAVRWGFACSDAGGLLGDFATPSSDDEQMFTVVDREVSPGVHMELLLAPRSPLGSATAEKGWECPLLDLNFECRDLVMRIIIARVEETSSEGEPTLLDRWLGGAELLVTLDMDSFWIGVAR